MHVPARTIWMRAVLALVVAVAIAAATEAPRARAQTAGDGIPPIVRVAARGTASGSVEFAIQQLSASRAWGELQFGRSRFMTPELIALKQWRYASPVTVQGGAEARVAARGTASGSVEFAIQARVADGAWGELLFGRSRFMTPPLIELRQWRYASPVVVRPVSARPPTGSPPTTSPPSGSPSTGLPCENCRADPANLWINFTHGDGVASRNDCLDSARTGRTGLPERTPVERIASGTGRCGGWSYVKSGGNATWVRDRYLSEAHFQYDEWWQPPLPMQFCTIPLDPDLGAGFSADEFREAVEDAVDTWNDALQEADHERALSGPAIDYVGDCADGERGSPRNQIAVARIGSAGLTTRSGNRTGGGQHCFINRDGAWECQPLGEPERWTYDADVWIAPRSCGYQATITHELGHALGLEHGGRLGDLMYQVFTGCPTSLGPNAVEVAAILEGRADGE